MVKANKQSFANWHEAQGEKTVMVESASGRER